MIPLRLMPEASERLGDVLSVAARLIAREGFERASIRAISEEADLSQAGLYHYFRGKEHLLYLIQKHTFAALRNLLAARLDVNAAPIDRFKIMIRNHLEFFIAHMDELRVCAFEYKKLTGKYYDEVKEIRKDYFRISHQIIKEIIKDNPDFDQSQISTKRITLYIFGALNWIHMWMDTNRNTDIISEMTEELSDMILYGISKRKK